MLTRSPFIRVVAVVVLVIVAMQAGASRAAAIDLFDALRTFPGVVLVPGEGLAPFDGLEAWRIELNRPKRQTETPRGRYLIQYRQRSSGRDGRSSDDGAGGVGTGVASAGSATTGSAQLGGVVGRAEFDETVQSLATLSYRRCAADAAYCTENVGGQEGAAPASEVFRGLTVGDGPAVVEHVTCCGGHFWSVSWFDPVRDLSYEMVLVGSLADELGSSITEANISIATDLTELAARLVPLS